MRHLITIVEDAALLTEAKTYEVPSLSGEVRVWEDPGEATLRALTRKLGELRGVTFDGGHVWVWQAYAATHQDVRQANKLTTEAHFYISGQPAEDESWTLGMWAYPSATEDMTVWIDHQTVPPRLRSIFSGPGTFMPWQTPVAA